MRGGRALALLLILPACLPATAPPSGTPAARYVVGEPYRLDGRWYYPREDPSYAETGLATVAGDGRAGRRTANGDVHDPGRPSAAHRTLPMPSVVRVTNLENGRELLLRVNDRGPANPGRIVELSDRAAELLGVVPGRAAQVRVALEAGMSRAVAASVPSSEPTGPRVETVPVAAIARESLAPPPGARGEAGRAVTAPGADTGDEAAAAPVSLPDRATEGVPRPGRLVLVASTFAGREAAARQAARIGGARAEAVGTGRGAAWRVLAGPYGSVEEADRALDAALRSGVSEARILVE